MELEVSLNRWIGENGILNFDRIGGKHGLDWLVLTPFQIAIWGIGRDIENVIGQTTVFSVFTCSLFFVLVANQFLE